MSEKRVCGEIATFIRVTANMLRHVKIGIILTVVIILNKSLERLRLRGIYVQRVGCIWCQNARLPILGPHHRNHHCRGHLNKNKHLRETKPNLALTYFLCRLNPRPKRPRRACQELHIQLSHKRRT